MHLDGAASPVSCLQGTQAAAANQATSPLDGFEAAVRVARNDAACRIPIVYRYAAQPESAPLSYPPWLCLLHSIESVDTGVKDMYL